MTVATLPKWDMTAFYPDLEHPNVQTDLSQYGDKISELEHAFDKLNIHANSAFKVAPEGAQTFEALLQSMNQILELKGQLGAYLRSFVTTDATNAAAQAKLSAMEQDDARFNQLMTRWTAWLGSINVEALIEQSGVAKQHAFMLHRAKIQAKHQMSPEAEALAAQLSLSGGLAWAKLHGSFGSQITVNVKLNGKTQSMPMSAVRNLASDENREVRKTAFEAELKAWKRAELPLAAALNGVKGEVNALAKRRGWQSALDAALFQSNIDGQTLDAMLGAAKESFVDFRRYLKAKAKALGQDRLPWYDLFAPIGAGRAWTYDEAQAFIVEHFGSYSDKMQRLAQRAFDENWIDAEPRTGKRDGAFCMTVRGDESRILTNFKPSYGGIKTLAHELGHAYHNVCLAECDTKFQRSTPMTLAETASIFCETVVREAALKQLSDADQLAVLESSLQSACQVVVDISSRFLFEQALFEQRGERELSADELSHIMLDAQKQTYGDGLDADALHPYMWAVKPHYYRPELSYYNFPYMFGLLFGLGLYAQYQSDPDGFKTHYDELLASTGKADAATLAQNFHIDIRTPEFWRSSLDVVRADIDRFVALV